MNGHINAISATIGGGKRGSMSTSGAFVPMINLATRSNRLSSSSSSFCRAQPHLPMGLSTPCTSLSRSQLSLVGPEFGKMPSLRSKQAVVMKANNAKKAAPLKVQPVPRNEGGGSDGSSSPSQRVKVLVLNASYEPIAIISACRALSLVWSEKASLVVPRKQQWISCGGQEITIPSVVSLRRYVKVRPRTPPPNRRTILLRDEGVCQYCGSTAENVDHVIPRSKGGLHRWDNVAACCRACNSRKADKFLKDLDMKLKRPPAEPTNICWVHNAVWKVEPCWRPYVGSLLWEDIQAQLPVHKSSSKSKKSKASRRKKRAANKASAGEAASVIAAYTAQK
eukprot:CAMPEP_0181346842 /NCGR_PEP_ID=MMETSP1101-20121128/33552_1 /TAXON_ID=46948 /ORGANISM="Rhodomonas abbreviata, Strain Caron Lab Isolate" /LENGTH=336 /DNA_ID=CAMNT_0023458999 /DNA_START=565 /DNA_END=1575 /DNA_ORIENTATION=-